MPRTSRQPLAPRYPNEPAHDRPKPTCRGPNDRISLDRRRRDLQRLLPMWPEELADRSAEARKALLTRLRRALREERRRGLAGHWAYDLARHAALYRIYQEELKSEDALSPPKDADTATSEPPDRTDICG